MPADLSYRIDGDLLTIRLVGDYPLPAYLELVRRALADPSTPERVRVLVDASASTVKRGADDMRAAAIVYGESAARIHRIAVVTGTEVHYGLIRMAGAFADTAGIESSPFRSKEEALRWLGVPDAG